MMGNPTLWIKSRAAVLVAVATAGLLAAAKPPPPPPLPELNEKVLAFARASLGKPVGDGSCTTLAIAALKQAGARAFPSAESGGDFTWGTPIESFNEALPGDVLQFHNAVFQGKRATSRRAWTSWHEEYLHHTAILSGVSEGGKIVSILHQNVVLLYPGTDPKKEEDGSKNVREGTLRMNSLQKGGWVRIYRPVAARGRGETSTIPASEAEEPGATTADDPKP
jgi:hypothetical protein